jgi:hypothetical protein
VLETNGAFTRALGTAANQVRWLDGSGGGFSAFGGNLLVDIGGNGPSNFTVGNTDFIDVGQSLFFGSRDGTGTVTFVDNIHVPAESDPFALLSRDAEFSLLTSGMPFGNTQHTIFTGQITGPGRLRIGRSTSAALTNHAIILTNINTVAETQIASPVVLNGSLETVSVRDNGILSGNGFVSSLLLGEFFSETGVVSPGDPFAANRVGQFLVAGPMEWLGGTLEIEVRNFAGDTPGVDWDVLTIADTVDLNTINIDGHGPFLRLLALDPSGGGPGAANFDPAQGYSIEILRSEGGFVGIDPLDTVALNNLIGLDLSQFSPTHDPSRFCLTSDGTSLFLNYNYVPEPGSAAVLMMFVVPLLHRRSAARRDRMTI